MAQQNNVTIQGISLFNGKPRELAKMARSIAGMPGVLKAFGGEAISDEEERQVLVAKAAFDAVERTVTYDETVAVSFVCREVIAPALTGEPSSTEKKLAAGNGAAAGSGEQLLSGNPSN
jgi:hypothetical protein